MPSLNMPRHSSVIFLCTVLALTKAAQPPTVPDSKCSYTTYSIRVPAGNSFKESYRICYNSERKAVVYSQHIIYPMPAYVNCRERTWRTSSILTSNQNKCLNRRDIGKYLKSLTNLEANYNRGQLTPCADFPTAPERSATFEVINSTPQLAPLNQGSWRSMEGVIRKQATTLKGIDVVTGVLGEVQHNGRPIYLIEGRYAPIAEFIYKVVRVNRNPTGVLYAFIAYNGLQAMNNASLQSVCSYRKCDKSFANIHCCDPVKFIKQYLPSFRDFFHIK